jgi:hypothetical protein
MRYFRRRGEPGTLGSSRITLTSATRRIENERAVFLGTYDLFADAPAQNLIAKITHQSVSIAYTRIISSRHFRLSIG